MSATLYWAPVADGAPLPYALRAALEKRFPQLYIDTGFVFNSGHRDYLAGLKDAGLEGADTLYHALEKYGSVRVWARD